MKKHLSGRLALLVMILAVVIAGTAAFNGNTGLGIGAGIVALAAWFFSR